MSNIFNGSPGWPNIDGTTQEDVLNTQQQYVADQRMLEQDRLSKLYLDEAEFQKIASGSEMRESISHSMRGADLPKIALNAAYLSHKTGQEVTPTDYMAFRDRYAADVFGKDTVNDSEFFELAKGEFDTRKQKTDALTDLRLRMAATSLEDAVQGKRTPVAEVFSSWRDKHAEVAAGADDMPFLAAAIGSRNEFAKVVDKYAHLAGPGLDLLKKFTSGQAEMGALSDFAETLVTVPREDQEKVIDLIALGADAGQIDRGALKEFARSMGQSFSRGFNFIPQRGMQDTELAFTEAREVLDTGDVWLKGSGTVALWNVQRPGNTQVIMGSPVWDVSGRKATPEEIEKLKADADKALAVVRVERQLRAVADNNVDPIKRLLQKGTVAGTIEGGVYGVAGSLPLLAASWNPAIGTLAYQSLEYDRMMSENPDMNPRAASSIAFVEGAFQAAIDRLQLDTLAGALPMTGKLLGQIKSTGLRRTLGFGASGFEQAGQEFGQDLGTKAIDSLASAIRSDMKDKDFAFEVGDYFKNEAPETLVASLIFGMWGGGVITARELRGTPADWDNAARIVGISEQGRQRMRQATSPEELDAVVARELKAVTPEAKAAGALLAKQQMQAAAGVQADIHEPTLEISKDEAGKDLYTIRTPDDQVLITTADPMAAQAAFLDYQTTSQGNEAQALRDIVDYWQNRDPNLSIDQEKKLLVTDELARMEGIGDAAGIAKLRERLVAADFNPDGDLTGVQIFGSATIEEIGEGVYNGTVLVREGATPDVVLEEVNHVFVRRALAKGDVTFETLTGWLDQTATSTGLDIKRSNETEVIESIARVGMDLVNGRLDQSQLPQSFVDYLRRLMRVIKEIYVRAVKVTEAFDRGEIDSNFEDFLMESMGMSPQRQIEINSERAAAGVASGVDYSIGAYHGTPHKIDPREGFRLNKIGTGEGAQVYGHGLYFAESPDVGEEYRKRLSASALTLDGIPIAEVAGPTENLIWSHAKQYYADGAKTKDALLTKLESARNFERDRGNRYFKDEDYAEVISAVEASKEVGMRTEGNLYTVDLDLEPEDFLDWDKPMGEQGEKVKQAFLARSKKAMNSTYKNAFKKIFPFYSGDGRSVREVYRQFAKDIGGSEKDASDFLRGMGIPGIRYLDQGSRASGAGTYNYVVFDESKIKIIAENGQSVVGTDYSIGKAKGAPKWVNAPATPEGRTAAYQRLRDRLYKLVEEGEPGRFWYEDSGRAVLRMFNNDVVEAEKFIELLAIYSPQATVEVNTYFALRAYVQKALDAAKADFMVKTGAQDAKAISVLYDNSPWAGRKTDNFYKNIMYVLLQELPPAEVAKLKLDPETYAEIQKPVTVDMWVYRAFGFDSDALTDVAGTGAFGFAERELNRIAEELNTTLKPGEPPYLPHQIQAMLWTSIKGRAETKSVKDLTEQQSMKAGDMLKVKNEKGKLVREFPSKEAQKRHMARWTKNALALPDDQLDVTMAAGAFDRFINSVSMRALWEAVPSTGTAEGGAISLLPYEAKAKFTEASRKILLDENGRDLLAIKLGIPINVSTRLSGGYGPGITPNVVSELFPDKPAGSYDDDAVRAYARAIQYIFRQDAVPWIRYLKMGAANAESYFLQTPAGTGKRKFASQGEAEAFRQGRIDEAKAGLAAAQEKNRSTKAWDTKLAAADALQVRGETENYGLRLDFGEQLTPEDLDQLQAKLAEMHPSFGFTQVSPTQVVVVNFRDSETGLPALTDEQFGEMMRLEYGQSTTIQEFESVGEYGPVHDWAADPEGGSILPESPRLGPDVLEWIRGRRQVSETLQRDWAEGKVDYSLGRPRVNRAMSSALNAAPGERLAMYERAKEMFDRVAARRGDETGSSGYARTLQSLWELDAILKVLPAEVRGKVGGFTKIAELEPTDLYKGDERVAESNSPAGARISAWMKEGMNIGEAGKQTGLPEGYSTVRATDPARATKATDDFLVKRLATVGKQLDKYLANEYRIQIERTIKAARPKKGDNGVRKSTLGPAAQAFADKVAAAVLLDNDATAARLSAIEAALLDPETTDEARIDLVEEWGVVNTFGDLENRNAETLAQGLQELRDRLKAGRDSWRTKEEARIAEQRVFIQSLINGLGEVGKSERSADKGMIKRITETLAAAGLDHQNFADFLRAVLPNDELVARWSDAMRKADTGAQDMELAMRGELLEAIHAAAKAAGISKGRAIANLKTKSSIKVRAIDGRKVVPESISIELARKIVLGKADRSNLSDVDVETLRQALEDLPPDSRKESVTIQRVISAGKPTTATLTPAQAVQLELSWDQPDVQDKMRREGWTDESIEDIRAINSDPVAAATLTFLRGFYARNYATVNPVYARLFGMNMPQAKSYAPSRYISSNTKQDAIGLDGSPQVSGSTPGFAKSRVNHSAPIDLEGDALTVFQQHAVQTAHWVNFAEFAREARAITSNIKVRESIKQKYGKPVLDSLDAWVDQIEQRGANKSREMWWMSRLVGHYIGGMAISSLGFNLKTVVVQLDSAMRMLLSLDPRQIGRALMSPSELAASMPKAWRSPTVQRRLQGGMDPAAQFLFAKSSSNPGPLSSLAWLSMQPVQLFDAAATSLSAAMVFRANFEDAKAAGLPDAQAEEAALDAMDAAVYRFSQPTGFGSKSNVENNAGAFGKLLTIFMSDPRLKTGVLLSAVREISRGKNIGMNAQRIIAIEAMALVSHVIASAYRDAFSDEEDEDIWSIEGFILAMVAAPFQGLFVAGAVTETALRAALGMKTWAPPSAPYAGNVEALARSFKNTDKLLAPESFSEGFKAWNTAMRGIAISTPMGAPAALFNIIRPFIGLQQNLENEE